MSFERPWLLALGILGAIVVTMLFQRAERARDAQSLEYSSLQFFAQAVRPRTWPVAALRLAFVAALACFAFALGGARLSLPMPVRDGTVFICIDTSGSMASTDVQPTRAQAAQEAARAFVAETVRGTRVGIIAFATSAEVVLAPSADRDAVRAALDALPSPNGATAIGDALQLAERGLPATGHRVVVLVTDGVNNAGVDPQQVAAELGALHVPIYTIGIGTPSGDIIGGTQATIDEAALQAYARVSGGAYAHVEDARALRDALARLGRVTSFARQPVDGTTGFLALGAVLVVVTLLAGLARGSVP
ncbi:MAG: VWA domain-containing protein [bacterium]|nr:VWA domain-containing protein [bacterium]